MAPRHEEGDEAFRQLLDLTPAACFVYERGSGRILAANRAAARLYGYTLDELYAAGAAALHLSGDVGAFPVEGGGGPGASTHPARRHLRKDGATLIVEVHARDLTFAGRPARLVVAADLTERLGGDGHLDPVERDQFFQLSHDLMCVVGFDGVLRRVNPAFAGTLGYREDELVGRTYTDFVHPDDIDATVTEIEGHGFGDRTLRFEDRYRCRDGSYRTLSWSVVPVPELGVTYATARDVTAEKGLQQQLRHAQKMEAVGRLAGGVAHDFNNVLSVILGLGHSIADGLLPEDPLRGDLEDILAAADRASALTRQLLAFSRKQVMQPEILDLGQLIRGAEKMLRRVMGEDVEVVLSLADGLRCVKADRGQLEQVLLNLAVNARDAMPEGGRLTIETAEVDLDETYAERHHDVTPGRYLQIAVSDDGTGMDRATLDHLFEPFFTTKPAGKGTGLGLSTVYGIVRQSGGHVWVYSEVGRGTTFKVYLPASNEARSPGPRAAPPARGGEETILLVEDEPMVRNLAARLLRRQGYHVLEAANGGEALLLAEGHGGPIHLLLTDVVMPSMSGKQLAARLSALRPGLGVLFMSGYAENAIVHGGALEPGVEFIEKPLSAPALNRKVREVLDRASAKRR